MTSIEIILDFLDKRKGINLLPIILLILIIFSSCGLSNTAVDDTSELLNITGTDYSSECEVILKEDEYYKVYRKGYEFHYFLYACNGNVIKEDTSFREPNISMISSKIGKLEISSGTGRGSLGTMYFDIELCKVSSCFYYVVAQNEQYVAFFNGVNIVVQDIFNDNAYKENIILSNNLAKVEEPVISAEFSNNAKSLIIEYVADNNLESISETVDIRNTYDSDVS